MTDPGIIPCKTIRGDLVEITPLAKKLVIKGILCDIYDQEGFPVQQLMDFFNDGWELKMRVSPHRCEILLGYDIEIRFVKNAYEHPDYFNAMIIEDFAYRQIAF